MPLLTFTYQIAGVLCIAHIVLNMCACMQYLLIHCKHVHTLYTALCDTLVCGSKDDFLIVHLQCVHSVTFRKVRRSTQAACKGVPSYGLISACWYPGDPPLLDTALLPPGSLSPATAAIS